MKKSKHSELFGEFRSVTYGGNKCYVGLVLRRSADAAELPIGAVAILTNPTDPKLPAIKVVPSIYPSDSAEERARFDEKCERASKLAAQAIAGGATIEEAQQIIYAFLKTEVDAADIQRVRPYVRGRRSVMKGLKQENQQRHSAKLNRQQQFSTFIQKLCAKHPDPARKSWADIREDAAKAIGLSVSSTYRYEPKKDPRHN